MHLLKCYLFLTGSFCCKGYLTVRQNCWIPSNQDARGVLRCHGENFLNLEMSRRDLIGHGALQCLMRHCAIHIGLYDIGMSS